ncbi:hypothetical protein DFH06DRAFT_1392192 [Mycena polygramma]|nr:hypothetical protein DFH06DRAFT_1392192 [Mycena polygramma]
MTSGRHYCDCDVMTLVPDLSRLHAAFDYLDWGVVTGGFPFNYISPHPFAPFISSIVFEALELRLADATSGNATRRRAACDPASDSDQVGPMPSSSSSTTLILVHLPVDSSDWNLHTRTENVPGRKFPSMLVRLIHTHRTATQPPPTATTPNLASRGPDTPNAPRTQVITPSPRLRRQKLVSRLLLAFFLAQGRQRHTTGPYIPSVLFTWLIWSLEPDNPLESDFRTECSNRHPRCIRAMISFKILYSIRTRLLAAL